MGIFSIQSATVSKGLNKHTKMQLTVQFFMVLLILHLYLT